MTRTRTILGRFLCALALAGRLPSARATWLPVDLPFGHYLSEPVTAVLPAGPSDVWAVSTYGYEAPDRDHVRSNSLAYRSLNDARLWDIPWDAPTGGAAAPEKPFQDTQLYAAAFAGQDAGFLFGWQRPTYAVTDPPGPYAFYRTTDRGLSWNIATLPNATASVPDEPDFAIDAIDATHAVAVEGRHVFETADGTTWRERPGSFPRLFAVQARNLPAPRAAGTDAGRAVVGTIGPNGFTADLTVEGTFRALAFADAEHGWVAGSSGDPDAPQGQINGTADGRTWTRQALVPGVIFRGLAAVDTRRAFAVGERTGPGADRGVIYRTDDGGATWRFDAALPGRLYSVAFRDAAHGFAAGEGGVYRYVADLPTEPGDLDHSGQVDRLDVSALLRQAGGLRTVSSDEPPAGITAAVAALRQVTSDPPPVLDGSRAVIVYNTLSKDGDGDGVGDSEEVARYYAKRRGVPESHLVPMAWADPDAFSAAPDDPRGPRAGWANCYDALVRSLRERIDALGPGTVDTIVFTYGVPYHFTYRAPDGSPQHATVDSAVQDLYADDADNWSASTPYFAPYGSIVERYGRARFGAGGRPLGEPVVGPDGSIARGPFFLVGRIDGPDVATSEAMVDNALFAEAHYGPGGYEGIAYDDNRAEFMNAPSMTPYSLDDLRAYTPVYDDYASYDRSIARTILTFADRGLPWKDEVTYDSLGAPPTEGNPVFRDGTPARSAPRAMFYAGWYNYGRYYDAWDWLPGSVGIDFDSGSAAYYRDGRFFAGGALPAGLTALVGCIDEPFNYHPKPDALMEYLARGYTLGEAAALSIDTPRIALALVLGDPLYRPFPGHTARPVPVPTLSLQAAPGANGWTVTLTSDVPVRATLRVAADGADPALASPPLTGAPRSYALRHTFTVPTGSGVRIQADAEDATGRVTSTPISPLS